MIFPWLDLSLWLPLWKSSCLITLWNMIISSKPCFVIIKIKINQTLVSHILRVKLSSKNHWDEWAFLVIILSSLLYWVILLTQKSLIDYCNFSPNCTNSSNQRSKTYRQPPLCYAAKSPERHQFLGITFCGCLRECLIKLNVYYLVI